MSAKRVGSSAIDWAAFAARVPKTQKKEFAAFKVKCDNYLRNVNAYPASLPKIHWDQYATRISVPGMVDEFKKQYESLSIPYPADNYTSKINDLEKKTMQEVDKFVEESQKRIEGYQEELSRWEKMVPVVEMTMEEFAEEFPEHAINIDKPTMFPHTPDAQPGYVHEEENSGH